MAGNPPTIWEPQKGSQQKFLSCPIFETLFEGTRGNGKTDALLMDFLQHVGVGYGMAWQGILFRRKYKELADLIRKSRKWIPRIFPDAIFNETKMKWTFRAGESLKFDQFERPSDYWKYHGHEYPWIGWEELTTQPTGEGYESMKSCCRSSEKGMPRKYRSTCNPWGPGHNWVKMLFIDPAKSGKITKTASGGRVAIKGHLNENKILLEADPTYKSKIEETKDPAQRKAWLEGSWDIVSGGALDGYWYPEQQILRPFEIPRSWKLGRSFDWGSTKPFSVGWWATSDGTEVEISPGIKRTFPRGSVFRFAEYYGWNGEANQGQKGDSPPVAKEILKIEKVLGINGRISKSNAIADSSIFNTERGGSIADDMGLQGVSWSKANKSPGSRKLGLDKLRGMLRESGKENPEGPGLWAFENCRQFIRTMPILQMSEHDPEDVDTNSEDHIYDETRYFLLRPDNKITKGKINGS